MLRGRLRRLAARAAAVALFALIAAAPAADAEPFGMPLGTAPFSVAPSYGGDCTTWPNTLLNALMPLPGASGSCIWAHVPTPAEVQAAGGRNISLEPPLTGTVTQIQVSVGPVTGPMQVVVMRALYQNTADPGHPNDACCFPVARSQTFTPTANAITTVPVSLPVTEGPTPPPGDLTDIADFDTLGLAVLQPGVPIPLYYSGDASQPADFIWNTSQPSTVTPGFSMDTGGFFVAMSGEWQAGGAGGAGGGGGGGTGATGGTGGNAGGGAGGGGGTGPPGAAPGAATLPIGLADRVVPFRSGNANVGLQCASAAACIGQLLLQDGPVGGAQLAQVQATRAAKKLTTYGSAHFSIKAHGRKTVAVRLSKAAKRLLARHRSTKVWANVRLSTGVRYAIRITLRR